MTQVGVLQRMIFGCKTVANIGCVCCCNPPGQDLTDLMDMRLVELSTLIVHIRLNQCPDHGSLADT